MKFIRWNAIFHPNKEAKGGNQSDVQTRQMHVTVTHEVQKGDEPPARAEMCESFLTCPRAPGGLPGPSQEVKKVRKQESGLSQHQELSDNMLRYGFCWASVLSHALPFYLWGNANRDVPQFYLLGLLRRPLSSPYSEVWYFPSVLVHINARSKEYLKREGTSEDHRIIES